MKNGAITLLLVFLLSVILLAGCTQQQSSSSSNQTTTPPANTTTPPSPGLKVGDWVKYSLTETGVNISEDFTKVEITEISGTDVKGNITHYYTDGTTYTETDIELRTIGSAKANLVDFVIAANLNVGDSMTGTSTATPTVNKILTRNYNGASKEVVYFNQTKNDTSHINSSLQLYYDRQTGFLLEEDYNVTELGINIYSVHALLDSTNLWQA